jgi:hypothetical protein
MPRPNPKFEVGDMVDFKKDHVSYADGHRIPRAELTIAEYEWTGPDGGWLCRFSNGRGAYEYRLEASGGPW